MAEPARKIEATPPSQEAEKAGELDELSQARAARQEKLEGMLERNEAITMENGQIVPLDKLAEYEQGVRGKLLELQDRLEKIGQDEAAVDEEYAEDAHEAVREELESTEEKIAVLEKEKTAIETMLWGGKEMLKWSMYIPGGHNIVSMVDRYIGGTVINPEKGGVIFTREEHADIASKQFFLARFTLRALAGWNPGVNNVVKKVEPLMQTREKIINRQTELAKQGMDLPLPEEMATFAEIIPVEKLNDPKYLNEVANMAALAGEEVGGTAGGKIEKIASLVRNHPEAAGKILTELRQMTIDEKIEIDPETISEIMKAVEKARH